MTLQIINFTRCHQEKDFFDHSKLVTASICCLSIHYNKTINWRDNGPLKLIAPFTSSAVHSTNVVCVNHSLNAQPSAG